MRHAGGVWFAQFYAELCNGLRVRCCTAARIRTVLRHAIGAELLERMHDRRQLKQARKCRLQCALTPGRERFNRATR